MLVGKTVSTNRTPLFCLANICIKHFMKFCGNHRYQQCKRVSAFDSQTDFDFLPFVVVKVKSASVMLNRHDDAVAIDQLLVLRAGKVRPVTDGDNGRFRRSLLLIAECTRIQCLFRARVIWRSRERCLTRDFPSCGPDRIGIPLTAKARFIASFFIFFRASFSILSSM